VVRSYQRVWFIERSDVPQNCMEDDFDIAGFCGCSACEMRGRCERIVIRRTAPKKSLNRLSLTSTESRGTVRAHFSGGDGAFLGVSGMAHRDSPLH
jgi:hypothetical protein